MQLHRAKHELDELIGRNRSRVRVCGSDRLERCADAMEETVRTDVTRFDIDGSNIIGLVAADEIDAMIKLFLSCKGRFLLRRGASVETTTGFWKFRPKVRKEVVVA